MVEIVYKERTFNATSFSALNGKKYLKILTCPYCGVGTDAPCCHLNAFTISDGFIANGAYKCTSCDKIFHVSYVKLNKDERFEPFCIYPNFQGRNFSQEIMNVSP